MGSARFMELGADKVNDQPCGYVIDPSEALSVKQ